MCFFLQQIFSQSVEKWRIRKTAFDAISADISSHSNKWKVRNLKSQATWMTFESYFFFVSLILFLFFITLCRRRSLHIQTDKHKKKIYVSVFQLVFFFLYFCFKYSFVAIAVVIIVFSCNHVGVRVSNFWWCIGLIFYVINTWILP